jgi:DNA-binding GntR family transcriptional regulator
VSDVLQKGEEYTIEGLNQRYDAPVDEIRQVTRSLIRKGLVDKTSNDSIRIHGSPEAEIESVFQYAKKSKLKPRTIVRSVKTTSADDFLAKKLKVTLRAPVYVQIRTRMVDEEVLANQYNFIPFQVCPGLEKIDLSRRSFQVTLEEQFHTVITRIEEIYTLGKPARDDEEILDVDRDAKILIVQRTSFSRNDYPLVFADIHVHPAQFHYVKDLWPKALPLVQSLG